MKHVSKVWIFPAACGFLLFPWVVSGQQTSQPQWQQGASPPSFQSPKPRDSSQPSKPSDAQRPVADHAQPPPDNDEQSVPETHQPTPLHAQEPEIPLQHEIPAVWPPVQPATGTPGYLGIRIRDFYRERFCMHALTIQGVEVAAVEPSSPAERAGLRPARGLSAREIAAATVAGLLTLSPVSSLAAPVLRAAGGVAHGDIILAVGGKRVKTQTQFQEALSRFGPRTIVHLTLRRGEAVLQLPVPLDDWPTQVSAVSLQQPASASPRN
jgi:hypothetical protein